MKKALSLIIAAIMILSALTVFVSAAGEIDYASKNDGDVLYEVDFRGTDGIYKPFMFRAANDTVAAATFVPSEDGKSLTGTCVNTAGAVFYGGKIAGLTLGEGKKYTITLQMSFPSGNAGFYFNFGYSEPGEGYSYTANSDYNGLYGIYGKLTGTSLTLSRAAGGKQAGELKSDGSAYNASPVEVANGTLADVKVEIDGYFYSVWLKKTEDTEWTLYDQLNMLDISRVQYVPADNLGFSMYLYNKKATSVVQNVVIKKGCAYDASHSTAAAPAALAADKIDYNTAKNGDKLADLLFNATSGAYIPTRIGQNANAKTTISDDGKSYTVLIDGDKGGEWFGSTIGQLKITDSTKYTFKYKLKAANTDNTSTYICGITYNSNAIGQGARYNWYGTFSDTVKRLVKVDDVPTAANAVKYAYIGSNFPTYNYTDDNQKIFQTFEPKVDAEGFIDVAVELDGWTWTFYEVGADGSYTKLQTVDNKALTKAYLGHEAIREDDLAFIIYTYNANVTDTVSNVELFKGNVISNDYSATGSNPTTGDAAIWVVVVGAVALFGMGVALKARKA